MSPTADRFVATPAFRCHCPARSFPGPAEALEYARDAAAAHRVGYAVWRVREGRMRRLQTVEPADRPA
jgi:hypothetical protein